MLFVTPAAAEAVDALLVSSDAPAGAGLRLERAVDDSGEAAIGLQIVTEPGPDDETVPSAVAANVFLSPDVAGLLTNHVLDAEIAEDNVAFTLQPQNVNGDGAVER